MDYTAWKPTLNFRYHSIMSIDVNKTYKLFINGSFQRTESGRYYEKYSADNTFLANLPKASRKDIRNAVQYARAAQSSWQERTAYNRSQIVYRIAEMLRQEDERFIKLLQFEGLSKSEAHSSFSEAIDLLVHLAGWCDKFIQVTGTVNPVASSHFNFSTPEATGVVCTNTAAENGLKSVVHSVIPALCGGNTVVCLAENNDLLALDFSEILSNSDFPPGTVNILTGSMEELGEHMARHMDVNALCLWDIDKDMEVKLENFALENMKRVNFNQDNSVSGLDLIMNFQEIKTTWHPIDRIDGSGSGY